MVNRRLTLSLILAGLLALVGVSGAKAQSNLPPAYAGQQSSILPNVVFNLQNYTATAVAPTTICFQVAAGTPCVMPLAGASSGTVSVIGTGLTTVTFQVQGSNDGVNFFPLNSALITAPGTVATSQTATANGLYVFDLADLTAVRIVTTGTFTATNVAFKLSASANKGLL